MFSGLVQSTAKICEINHHEGITELILLSDLNMNDIQIGDSICCSGICLSVTKMEDQSLTFQASQETLDCTNMKEWQTGQSIHIEPSLKFQDLIGGHILSGHVDEIGKISKKIQRGESIEYHIEISLKNKNLVAAKGSIALDGVSLTVNEVYEDSNSCYFTVNIIPITQDKTNFGCLSEGDFVNVEFETIARYVARWFDAK